MTASTAAVASASFVVLAQGSARTRKCAAVTSMKISRATAVPMEAIASSLNTTISTRHAAAWMSSPAAELTRHQRKEPS